MIDIENALYKLGNVVKSWVEEKPDEYKAARDIIRKTGHTGSCDMAKKKLNYHDEYYTPYELIEYLAGLYDPKVFENKYVYCNCDAPWSNIYKYFRDNFDRLKLRHLTATAIPDDNTEWRGIRTDYDGKDERVTRMEWSGTFDSAESRRVLSQCDVVVTNPPFSLIKDYMRLVTGSGKLFMTFMSNMNVTYPYILDLYVKGVFNIITSRDMLCGDAKAAVVKSAFDRYVNYVVVSNIPGSAELEECMRRPTKYRKYDPQTDLPLDNEKGSINVDTLIDGIPLYFEGLIYCPPGIVSDIRWKRDDFDVICTSPRKDAVVEGKIKFRRIPIKLKNNKLQVTENESIKK